MSESKDEKSFEAEVEAEKKKISELFRELKSKSNTGQNDDKLNWMYKNPSENVEREEYLLGRSVDKALDSLTGKDLSTTNSELANFPKRAVNKGGNNEQVDIHKKIHEDPLFAIKQREIAARKQLLNNPIKVKELKEMVEMEAKKKEKIERLQRKEDKLRKKDERVNYLLIKALGKFQGKIDIKSLLNQLSDTESDSNENSRHKKTTSSKKPSRRKRKNSVESSDTDSESDSDSEDKHRNKSKSRKKVRVVNKKRKKQRESSSSSEEEEEKEPSKTSKTKKKTSNKRKKAKSSSSSNTSSDSESSSDADIKSRKSHSSRRSKPKSRKHKSSESSEESSSDTSLKASAKKRSKEKKDSKPSLKKQSVHRKRKKHNSEKEDNDRLLHAHSSQKPFGLSMLDGSKPDKTEKKVAVYKKEEGKKVSVEQQKPKPLTDKERDYELKEMMKNAKWRKNEREADYAKHKLVKQREDKLESYDESFIKNQMAILSSSGSMADRVKSKMNTVQRSRTTMDKSFVRK